MNTTDLENEVHDKYIGHCTACVEGKPLRDGLPDPEAYWSSPLRALFILKEPHGWEDVEERESRDLRGFALGGARYKTWANLARWSAVISDPSFEPTLSKADEGFRIEKLRSACFINLKKTPGGTRSDLDAITEFAFAHADLLREQIAIYRPDVTIACGTFAPLLSLYQSGRNHPPAEVDDGLYFFKTQELGTAIDFYHPQFFQFSAARLHELLRKNLVYHFPSVFNQA